MALRWRPIKRAKKAKVIPASAETARVVEGILRRRPGIGSAPLFPSFGDPSKPVSVKVASEWHVEAEEQAGVPHLARGLWHPYRRKWRSERRHLKDEDVAAVGGWQSIEVMNASYLAEDEVAELAVVNEPTKLRARKA